MNGMRPHGCMTASLTKEEQGLPGVSSGAGKIIPFDASVSPPPPQITESDLENILTAAHRRLSRRISLIGLEDVFIVEIDEYALGPGSPGGGNSSSVTQLDQQSAVRGEIRGLLCYLFRTVDPCPLDSYSLRHYSLLSRSAPLMRKHRSRTVRVLGNHTCA